MPTEVVAVTGGAGGIGVATARAFARESWRVALIDVDSAALERARRDLAGLPGEVATFLCDVADHTKTQRTAAALLERFGAVDVLVNNAGVSQPKPVVELEEQDWDRTLAINLKSAFNWCKALLPSMLERKHGRIVNVSSISAKHGGGYGTVSKACYAASKAGLLGFTRGLAREAAPHVQVNAVCPGLIETPMTRALIARAGMELKALIPLERFGAPEDVAAVIYFLASPSAAYLTGEIIDVNGGMLID